jgi:chromosome segregation ATPase
MGVFSTDNVVVLVLNLLVCVFFYLMSNSKRLEKVKKYGGKLMAEMRELANSAKEPLENFKIDLEVETKAAEQLLLRLKDVRAAIAGYEENIKRIDDRFEQYKTLLSGLDRESVAVEENLLRIRDESVFADGVSRKLADARKRFDALERDLGHLKESMLGAFEKTNAERLEKTAASLLAATKETAVSLQSEIERNINTLTQTADTAKESVEMHLDLIQKAKEEQEAVIENSKNEVNRFAEDAVKKAGERSVEYENQLFRQFREEADRNAMAAQEKVENDWAAIQKASDENSAAISTIGEEIENAKAGVRDAISRAAEEEEALWHEKLSAARNEFEEFSKSAAELEDRIKTIQAQIGDVAEKIETVLSESLENAARDAAENAGKFGDEKFYTYRAELEEKLSVARNEFDLFTKSAAEMEDRIKTIQAQIGDATEKIETSLSESLETATENAEKFGNEKFYTYRAELEEKLSVAKGEFDVFSKSATELEDRIKTIQAQIGDAAEKIESTLSESLENAARDAAENAEKFGNGKFYAYRAELEEKLSAKKGEFETFTKSATELEDRIKTIQAQIGDATEKIERNFGELLESAARDAAENAKKLGEEKFDSYRAELEETLSVFGAATGEKINAANASVTDTVGSLNDLVQKTGNEINEKVESIKNNTDKAKADIENLAAEFETLKNDAADSLSGRIAQLEEAMTVSLHEKIEKLRSAQEAEYTKIDSEIAEKYRAAAEETGGKWTGEFERLKEKLDVFENALRLEMDAAGESLAVYKESMEQSMDDLRKNTELDLKTEIGKIALEANERLRSHQREFEDSLKSLATDVKKRLEGTQTSIEETGVKSAEALRAANENIENTAQKIAALDAEIQNAQKEMADFSEQTKLFEQADNLKVELERKIEDMEADIERLAQEKNVLAGMELQFGKIQRMEEDMNAKMTRFLAEQKRIDIMESDFNRLVKMSGDIEDKLRSIAEENETLEQVQVKLRKLYEAAEASEEKYQRVEKRNNIVETTNAGISANFKKLEDAERRLEARQADIENIEKEISGVKEALVKVKFENGEALEISRALSTLDTSLAEIEERIEKMETAREWLAGVETRINELHRNTMENINRIDDKTKRSLSGSRSKVDVLSSSIQDEVRRLKHDGWKVEDIAKNYGMSIGEIQLILEKSPT